MQWEKKGDKKRFFAYFRRKGGQKQGERLFPSRALRARLAFASVRLKCAKKLRLLCRRESFNMMFE